MTRLRTITSTAVALAGLAIPTVGVGAASAAPAEWEPFLRGFSFVEEDGCGVLGLTLEHVFVSEGRERITARGYATHEKVTDTVTNVATGESVTVVTDFLFTDVPPTDNGDGTSTIFAQRPARYVYIQDGQVIARGAGLMRVQGLIDNGGTPTDPSDDEFLEQTTIKNVGNPPDYCTTIIQAIG